MSWTYKQSSGELVKPDGTRLAYGFAGQGEGLNEPSQQHVKNIGPLPVGEYTMTGWVEKHPNVGLCVIVLEPMPANSMFGRSAFLVHGARNITTSGLKAFLTSSEGCICVASCTERRAIWKSSDRILKVVA